MLGKPNWDPVERVKTPSFGNHLPTALFSSTQLEFIHLISSHLILSYRMLTLLLSSELTCTRAQWSVVCTLAHLNEAAHDCMWQGFRLLLCVCARAVVQKRLEEIKCADFLTLEMVPWFGCTTLRNKWVALVPLTTGTIDKCNRMKWIQGVVACGIVSFKFFQGRVQGSRATSYPNYMHNDKTMIVVIRGGGPHMQVSCPLANSNVDNIHLVHLHRIWMLLRTPQECRPHYHWLCPKHR